MRTVKASEFEAKCLQLIDEVVASGETLAITRNCKPVAELTPARQRQRTLIGAHAGQIEILGDIVSSLDEPWEALENPS